jgi:prephenate dehydrogenase
MLWGMRIGVFGTGRFGSFWASQLARSCEVLTYNRSDRPVPEGARDATLDELGSCDAVMLCVAISSVGEAVTALASHLRPGCVLMDTCSVKVYAVTAMLEHAPVDTPIIGTHPMFGPDSAGGGMTGRPIVYCPVRCDQEAVAEWRSYFTSLGLVVHEMAPDQHDREAAFTQGITHFLGRVLADMGLKPSPIGTVGYDKMLEVMEQTCNDPYTLFRDLQHYNPHTPEMRIRLQESIDRIMSELDSYLDTDNADP